ncbi:STAS domain-containing protein [Baekduia alba]|uniref:STAS domain-containing protein n=1 Tax=Baekduia alba TaxID=2997333 RepID=UPI002341A73D|nr:STAS domain-containing protein [Baekduia alba]
MEAQRVEHVALSGELDVVGAPDAERAIVAALRDREVSSIVLHLDEVEFIDSCGLRVLVGAADAADRRGVELRILPGRLEVMAVVEAAALAGRLPFVGWP